MPKGNEVSVEGDGCATEGLVEKVGESIAIPSESVKEFTAVDEIEDSPLGPNVNPKVTRNGFKGMLWDSIDGPGCHTTVWLECTRVRINSISVCFS